MSKEIKKYVPNALITGNTNPPRTGAFEIIINQKLVFSKIKTNEFPSDSEISSWFK